MIRALFFDLDGTLLTGEKKISAADARTLKRCREKGVKVFLATARSPMLDRMLGWTEAEFSLFDGGIYCNGACEEAEGRRVYTYLPADVVRVCVDETARFEGIHLAMHVENEVHVFNHVLPDFALDFWGLDRDGIGTMGESWYDRTVKVLIYRDSMVDATEVLPETLFERLDTACGEKANIYLADRGKTIIAVSREISKYTAIEHVRERLGLEKDEIAVFGDDVNDIEMLSGYKNSVAMGNTVDEVKRVAGYTTLSNDEGGVAYAIENILRII